MVVVYQTTLLPSLSVGTVDIAFVKHILSYVGFHENTDKKFQTTSLCFRDIHTYIRVDVASPSNTHRPRFIRVFRVRVNHLCQEYVLLVVRLMDNKCD